MLAFKRPVSFAMIAAVGAVIGAVAYDNLLTVRSLLTSAADSAFVRFSADSDTVDIAVGTSNVALTEFDTTEKVVWAADYIFNPVRARDRTILYEYLFKQEDGSIDSGVNGELRRRIEESIKSGDENRVVLLSKAHSGSGLESRHLVIVAIHSRKLDREPDSQEIDKAMATLERVVESLNPEESDRELFVAMEEPIEGPVEPTQRFVTRSSALASAPPDAPI